MTESAALHMSGRDDCRPVDRSGLPVDAGLLWDGERFRANAREVQGHEESGAHWQVERSGPLLYTRGRSGGRAQVISIHRLKGLTSCFNARAGELLQYTAWQVIAIRRLKMP